MGLIKPHLVIAEPSGQPHIGFWEDDLPAHQHISLRGRPCLEWRVVMAWSILFVAGLLEIAWAIGLKYTEGFLEARSRRF